MKKLYLSILLITPLFSGCTNKGTTFSNLLFNEQIKEESFKGEMNYYQSNNSIKSYEINDLESLISFINKEKVNKTKEPEPIFGAGSSIFSFNYQGINKDIVFPFGGDIFKIDNSYYKMSNYKQFLSYFSFKYNHFNNDFVYNTYLDLTEEGNEFKNIEPALYKDIYYDEGKIYEAEEINLSSENYFSFDSSLAIYLQDDESFIKANEGVVLYHEKEDTDFTYLYDNYASRYNDFCYLNITYNNISKSFKFLKGDHVDYFLVYAIISYQYSSLSFDNFEGVILEKMPDKDKYDLPRIFDDLNIEL